MLPSLLTVAQGLVALLCLGLWLMLVAASLHVLRLGLWAFRNPMADPAPPTIDDAALPKVTVQQSRTKAAHSVSSKSMMPRITSLNLPLKKAGVGYTRYIQA